MEDSEIKKLVIIGASGHGKVVADIAKKNGYREIQFLDDNRDLKECCGYGVGRATSCYNADRCLFCGTYYDRPIYRRNSDSRTIQKWSFVNYLYK